MQPPNNTLKRYAQSGSLIRDVIWAGVGALFFIWIFGGCAHTIVPKQPQPATVRFDQNAQNAGVIDCDAKGCIVTSGWIGRYRALEKEFNHTIPADSQITVEGQNFRVSYEVSNNFADLQRSHRSAP